MPRFRKKPVVIEAVQWTGMEEDLEAVFALVPTKEDGSFDLPDDGVHVHAGIGFVPPHGTLDIPTLEGVMTAQPGDWIIRGVNGEIYPCKPDIFEKTYDAVDDEGELIAKTVRQQEAKKLAYDTLTELGLDIPPDLRKEIEGDGEE